MPGIVSPPRYALQRPALIWLVGRRSRLPQYGQRSPRSRSAQVRRGTMIATRIVSVLMAGSLLSLGYAIPFGVNLRVGRVGVAAIRLWIGRRIGQDGR